MAVVRNVLIVGGGIGGLTAGVALTRKGINVEIVELQEELSVYGVGIIQPNNTLRALAKIGLAQACVKAGAPFPGWRIFDAAGNPLNDAPNTNAADDRYPPVNGITRPRLHEILSGAARASGVRMLLGDTIQMMTNNGEAIDVLFRNGREASYDIVIGSDGLNSDIRRQLFPSAGRPQFTGQGVWRYNLPRPASMAWGELYFGPNSKVGLVPMTADLMYMLVVTAEPGNPRFEGDRMAEFMRARLESYSGPITPLKEQIVDPAGVIYRPMESMLLQSPWHSGRAILIGDAAHSTTPHLAQGAAMAIEDAVLLGELLGGDGSVASAFDEFMARRFDRAKFVVDSSLQIGTWEMAQWLGTAPLDADPGGLLHRATIALMEEY